MTNATKYAVIYRTGGTENFCWHQVCGTFTRAEAATHVEELNRMGYPALAHDAARLAAVGLPETFSA